MMDDKNYTAAQLAAIARVKESVRDRFVLYHKNYNMPMSQVQKELTAEIDAQIAYAKRVVKAWTAQGGVIEEELNNMAISQSGTNKESRTDACCEIVKGFMNHWAYA